MSKVKFNSDPPPESSPGGGAGAGSTVCIQVSGMRCATTEYRHLPHCEMRHLSHRTVEFIV